MTNEHITEYGIKMSGSPLDGEELEVLPYKMTREIKTIICYDYEDGKPWHDVSCVMEIIFHNKHHEIKRQDEQRIRFLYFHPPRMKNVIAGGLRSSGSAVSARPFSTRRAKR